MKAITLERYGTPEVLNMTVVAQPTPGPYELMVRVKAASLNALDKHMTRGVLLARPKTGLFKPKFGVLGSDMAGIVEAVGEKVTEYKPGDRVFGGQLVGAFAEYAILEEGKAALIPDNVTFEEAAALPVAAGTALQALRKGKIKPGMKVLINGGSGGVGTYLVQLAHHFGAYTTAVCSGRNADMVKALGADEVIDYQTTDFINAGEHYDLIIDNVGNLGIRDYKQLLTARGLCLVNGMTTIRGLLWVMIQSPFVSKKNGQRIQMLDAKVNHADLAYLAELLANDQIKSVIEKQYPLEETREAVSYLWTRRARGKLVLSMGY